MTSLRGLDPSAASFADSATPSELFEQLLANFEAAAVGVGNVERGFSIAGRPIRLRFAGPALISRLTPALDHLRSPGATDADTVLVWDSRSTGQAPLHRSARGGEEFAAGRIRGCRTDYSLSLFDAKRRLGLFWVEDAETLPYYESCAPLRRIF